MKAHFPIMVIFVLLEYSCAENSVRSSAEDSEALRNFERDNLAIAVSDLILGNIPLHENSDSFEVDESVAGLSTMFLSNTITEDFDKDKSAITAIVNAYMDRLFQNIHNFAIKSGLDPTPLQNISQRFLTEHVTLKQGLLHGISTLQRLDTAQLTYSHNKKILTVQFPIVFSNLSFTYDYELTLLLLKHTGGMTGLIKNFTMDLVLQFDFNTYRAALLKSSVLGTGSITLTFEKNVIDIVLNILSNFVTVILKPVLVLAIQGIVAAVGGKLVDVVNHVIDHILHPSAAQIIHVLGAMLYQN